MKKINHILRKCKSLSRQLGRSSSYSSLRSKSTREEPWGDHHKQEEVVVDSDINGRQNDHETIFVGSTRKRYVISSKYLSHPLLNALIERSKQRVAAVGDGNKEILVVKCEVVLFDHLLWLLENGDPNLLGLESLEELADLYVF